MLFLPLVMWLLRNFCSNDVVVMLSLYHLQLLLLHKVLVVLFCSDCDCSGTVVWHHEMQL